MEFIKKLQSLSEHVKLAIIFTVVLMVGLGMGFFWIQSTVHSISSISQSFKSADLTNLEAPTDVVEPTLNVNWKNYENNRLGFSMDLPNITGIENDKVTKLEVFDDGKSNLIYIAPSQSADQMSDLKNDTPNSFEILDKLGINSWQRGAWQIVFSKIDNDAELLKFFTNNFYGDSKSGSQCKIESKKESTQPGVFDIKIKGLGFEGGDCFLGYSYILKYYPQEHRAVFWGTGQAYYFRIKDDMFDPRMIESFKFTRITDWKTYKNEEYGFEFKYPKDWYTKDDPAYDRVYITNTLNETNKENSRPDFQGVWISHSKEESSLQKENDLKIGKSDSNAIFSSVSVSTIENNGVIMDMYEYKTAGGPVLEVFWTDASGQRYYATNATEGGNQKNMVYSLKKILSTFKFTN